MIFKILICLLSCIPWLGANGDMNTQPEALEAALLAEKEVAQKATIHAQLGEWYLEHKEYEKAEDHFKAIVNSIDTEITEAQKNQAFQQIGRIHTAENLLLPSLSNSLFSRAYFWALLFIGTLFFIGFRKNKNDNRTKEEVSKKPTNLQKNQTMEVEEIEQLKLEKLAVEKRNRKLEKENEELKKFGYMATHDLKEPLRTIGSYASLINRRYKKDLDEDGRQFLAFISDGIDRMHNLLHDVMNYSDLGKSMQEGALEVIDIKDLIYQMEQNLQKQIEDKNACLIIENLPNIKADRNHLTHIFQNLISNGLKYNDKAEPFIRISARKAEGMNIFEIEDNGIGIDPEFGDKIFEVFQRLHSKEEFEGTGIGLAIVKRLIKFYNGDIWVESEKGKGSKFCFSFPEVQQEEIFA